MANIDANNDHPAALREPSASNVPKFTSVSLPKVPTKNGLSLYLPMRDNAIAAGINTPKDNYRISNIYTQTFIMNKNQL